MREINSLGGDQLGGGAVEALDEGAVLLPQGLGQALAEPGVVGRDQGGLFLPDLRIDAEQKLELLVAKLPRIYFVNWFRKDMHGKFLWPGYGENSRVLRWVFDRCEGTAVAADTPIGRVPARGQLDLAGLDVPAGNVEKMLNIDIDGWLAEVPLIREHFAKFGSHLPDGLRQELDRLEQRLKQAKAEKGVH